MHCIGSKGNMKRMCDMEFIKETPMVTLSGEVS